MREILSFSDATRNSLKHAPVPLPAELVAATLSEPETYLKLEPVSFTLDHSNTKVPADAPSGSGIC
ncbi:MAG: hypothetical protein IPM89_12245 [Candidatus Competibacteraceae bacterium]|nr:MAG: hypothetical protein IPM89_12245 [Candidatus Competibacteraceae bacterium]